MAIGNWLKAHRKKVIIHGLIILAFLLYVGFLADPLFDIFERVPGEAKLSQFRLPAETNDIKYAIDDFSTDGRTVLDMKGWAFIEGESSDNSKTYVVLKSAKRIYIFDTMLVVREDVTRGFRELNLNLDYSGFMALIPVRKLDNGQYTLGIYIRKGDIEALQYADKAISKYRGSINCTLRKSNLQNIALPIEPKNIKLAVDFLQYAVVDEKRFAEITGWAFIEGQDTENSQIYIVLKSDLNTYVFDTILRKRPDITSAFAESGLNLDNSGFIARILEEEIEGGTYTLGIYVKKGDIEVLRYTNKLVEF
ncbi:MAG: hypothetical protein ACETWD_02275 [Desulfatiglandales bacterium]